MNRTAFLPLLLALLALPAAAHELDSVFAPAQERVAQLSREERRALQERWEEASPEDRAALRRSFQNRLQPQERYAPYARDPRPDKRGRNSGVRGEPMYPEYPGGFGTGYEKRHHAKPSDQEDSARRDYRDHRDRNGYGRSGYERRGGRR